MQTSQQSKMAFPFENNLKLSVKCKDNNEIIDEGCKYLSLAEWFLLKEIMC